MGRLRAQDRRAGLIRARVVNMNRLKTGLIRARTVNMNRLKTGLIHERTVNMNRLKTGLRARRRRAPDGAAVLFTCVLKKYES